MGETDTEELAIKIVTKANAFSWGMSATNLEFLLLGEEAKVDPVELLIEWIH